MVIAALLLAASAPTPQARARATVTITILRPATVSAATWQPGKDRRQREAIDPRTGAPLRLTEFE